MKSVLITGISRGIGKAVAAKFHKEKYIVIGCARGEEGLERLRGELPGVHTYICDMGDKEMVKDFAKKIKKDHGIPDILVNNAGVFKPGEICGEEDELFEELMNINLRGTYYLTKALAPGMKERKSGCIINMCSTASIMGYPNGGSYCISKHAMLGLSRALRAELMEHNVAVSSIMPGPTWSSSWEGAGIDPERMMPADDIAKAVWMAASMDARSVAEEILLRPQLGDL